MKVRTRMCMSLDGYVTTPDGWPAQLADPKWDPEAYGFVEFQRRCDAVLMGRTTFEPALGRVQLPWTDLDVFVLGSHRPSGTPDHVVVEATRNGCWRRSGPRTRAATSTSSAGRARSRPTERSGRLTSWG
jgi:dihydrofolate reductase